MKHNKKTFFVFASKTHCELRILLVVLLIFSFYVSIITKFLWMYIISTILLINISILMGYIDARVTISENGLRLRHSFTHVVTLSWSDILCCGHFSMKTLGGNCTDTFLYFSKKPIDYNKLFAGKTLPRLTDDLLIVSARNEVFIAIDRYWNSSKKDRILTIYQK